MVLENFVGVPRETRYETITICNLRVVINTLFQVHLALQAVEQLKKRSLRLKQEYVARVENLSVVNLGRGLAPPFKTNKYSSGIKHRDSAFVMMPATDHGV